MDSNMPKVSVLMCVYNTPINYLKEAIESILNQTYTNFEFIIIDDGSDKETLEFIKSYDDARIKLHINEKNMGLEKSLNKGISLANSDYIVRMDSDDIAYENRIELQVRFIINNSKYALVGSRANYFNDEYGIYGTSKKYGEMTNNDLVMGTPFIHPSLIIKKKVLEEIGGYPLYRRCEDYAMAMEMYSRGYIGYVMEDVLLKYRVEKDSYKKRKLSHRITSVKLRLKYYPKIKIKFYKYIFAFKPLATGKIFCFFKNTINKIRKGNKR